MRPWSGRVGADQDLAAGTQNDRIEGELHPPCHLQLEPGTL